MALIDILDYSILLYEETVNEQEPDQRGENRETKPSRSTRKAWRPSPGGQQRRQLFPEPAASFGKSGMSRTSASGSPSPTWNRTWPLPSPRAGAVRDADPAATVIGRSHVGIPLPFLEAVCKSGLLARRLDAASVDPYRYFKQPPESAQDDYAKIVLSLSVMPVQKERCPLSAANGAMLDIDKGVSTDTQAAYLVRQQLINLLAGVPISIWYDWKNDGPDAAEREHNFGTVTLDLNPKPAYLAVQTLARELTGYSVERRLNTESAKDYLLLCRNAAGEQKLAAWTLAASNSVSLFLTGSVHPIRVVASDGRPSEAQWRGGGLALELGPTPCYVTLGAAQIKN